MSAPRIRVTQGELEGISCVTTSGKKYVSFLGIPYGQPPVGPLRFKDPLPAEIWNGLRNATVEGNIAPQIDSRTNKYIGDEDCLFLNVHTPQLSPSDKTVFPVMVYIHGGAFYKGSGNRDEFGPEYIIEKDCILVTMNYRLAIFGFLCLESSIAPGNMGLKDQNLAMKWVIDNILSFGGDPGNITLFGNSAGASSSEFHVLSPMSRGLFHKVIIQSGSVMNLYFNNRPLDSAIRLAERLGKKLKDPKELYNLFCGIPAKKLIEESVHVLTDENVKLGKIISFTPVISSVSGYDNFLSDNPFNLLKEGKFMKIPTMSGYCNKEGILIKHSFKNKNRGYLVDHEMIECLPREFKVNKKEIDEKIKRIYRQRSEDRNVDDYIIDYLTDLTFVGGMYKSVDLKLKYQSNNYFYRFSYEGNINYLKTALKFQEKGACHADELGYLATHAHVNTATALPNDVLVRNRMVQMWTDFAKTGDPTPNLSQDINLKWLPVTEEKFQFLDIGEELTLKDDQNHDERRNLWKELYEFYQDE